MCCIGIMKQRGTSAFKNWFLEKAKEKQSESLIVSLSHVTCPSISEPELRRGLLKLRKYFWKEILDLIILKNALVSPLTMMYYYKDGCSKYIYLAHAMENTSNQRARNPLRILRYPSISRKNPGNTCGLHIFPLKIERIAAGKIFHPTKIFRSNFVNN